MMNEVTERVFSQEPSRPKLPELASCMPPTISGTPGPICEQGAELPESREAVEVRVCMREECDSSAGRSAVGTEAFTFSLPEEWVRWEVGVEADSSVASAELEP